MYVDLDNIINSMHPDQKLNLPYKASVEFFIENIDYLIDLHPRTMSPISWDFKRFREQKEAFACNTPPPEEECK